MPETLSFIRAVSLQGYAAYRLLEKEHCIIYKLVAGIDSEAEEIRKVSGRQTLLSLLHSHHIPGEAKMIVLL